MYKALIYKEFIKTRIAIITLIAVSIATHTYMYAKICRSIRIVGIDHLWEMIVTRNVFLFGTITYIPLLTGIAIGLAQFIPEIKNKSFKLSLHLPVKESATVITFIAYGLTINLIITILSVISITVFANIYFPTEIVERVIVTLLPWYLSGIGAYGITAWICLEPTWKRRFINGLIGLGLINLMFMTTEPGAYNQAKALITLIALIPYIFITESVIRFKQGVQD